MTTEQLNEMDAAVRTLTEALRLIDATRGTLAELPEDKKLAYVNDGLRSARNSTAVALGFLETRRAELS